MNSQSFTPKEVEKGLHLKLIKTLLEINVDKENYFNQIMIDTDGYCTIVNWVEKDYDDCSERFELLGDDDVIMKEVLFPDNHTECLFKEDIAQALDDWLKEHPSYKQNAYGIWYDEDTLTNQIKETNSTNVTPTRETTKQMSLEDFGIEIE